MVVVTGGIGNEGRWNCGRVWTSRLSNLSSANDRKAKVTIRERQTEGTSFTHATDLFTEVSPRDSSVDDFLR